MATFSDVLENDVLGANSLSRRLYLYDAADALIVRRTVSSLAKTGTGTGDIRPYGDHGYTANTSFKIEIDTAGDENSATFKWSQDGGATFAGELIPVTTLSRTFLTAGLSVVFAFGTYDLGDYWTFTAIGTANQLYDLKVDTTAGEAWIGRKLVLGNDAESYIYKGAVDNLIVYAHASSLTVGSTISFAIAPTTTVRFAPGEDFVLSGPLALVLEQRDAPPAFGAHVDDEAALYPRVRSGRILPYWQDSATGIESQVALTTPSRSIIPFPAGMPASFVSDLALAAVGTGYVGLMVVTEEIEVTQLRYSVPLAGSGGSSTCTVRCAVYNEVGTLLVNVTEALNVGSGVRAIAVGNIVLPPGKYYVAIGLSATTLAVQPNVTMWGPTNTFNDGGSGHIDLEGTMTWTAGAAPSVFDPLTAITPVHSRTAYVQLQGVLPDSVVGLRPAVIYVIGAAPLIS